MGRSAPDDASPTVTTDGPDEPSAAEPTDGHRRRDEAQRPLWRRIRPYYASVTLIFLAFIALGITTSSAASPLLQEQPGITEGTLLFEPQIIRTDEYLTSTPIVLGFIANGGHAGYTPLAQDPDLIYQVPSGSFFESLVFFDGSVLRLGPVLPDNMLFAGFWWLPTYLVAMALPFWLQRLGSRASLSYLAVALFVFAPATQWWSMIPTRILAFPLLASVLVMLGVDRIRNGNRATGFVLCALAGPLMARVVTNYVPWALTISIPLVLATAVWLLGIGRGRRKPAWIGMGVAAASSVLFLGMLIVENLDSIRSELSTVYPGLRTSSAEQLAISRIFGAPQLFNLHTYYPSGSNQSEFSSAFGVLLVVVLVVLLFERGWRHHRATGAIILLTAASAGWMLWSSVDLGQWTASIPLLNRVPATRASQTFGYVAGIALVLMLSRQRRTRPWTYLTAGALASLLTALAGRDASRTYSASLSIPTIVIVALCTGAVVALLVARPASRVVAAVAAAAALAVTFQVNPLQRGAGDLRDSALAQHMYARSAQSTDEEGYWASDSLVLDSVLTSAGVRHLSGNQVTGPIREQWKQLDPDSQYMDAWNRGASYLTFKFTDDQTPVIVNADGAPDHIVVQVDPCVVTDFGFELKYVVTTSTLDQSCVVGDETFDWGGSTVHVYELDPETSAAS